MFLAYRCYINGLNFDPLGIFPSIEYPVPRGTPMLSPLVTWDHTVSWDLPESADFLSGGHGQLSESSYTFITGNTGKDSYLLDHKISGLSVFPVAGYLVLAWKCLAKYLGQLYDTMPVQLEDVQFHRPTLLPDEGIITTLHIFIYDT